MNHHPSNHHALREVGGAEVTHHLAPFSKEHHPYGGEFQNSLKIIEIFLHPLAQAADF